MNLKHKMPLKIGTKILASLLLLSLISLLAFGYTALKEMKGLGNYALKGSVELGDQAVEDSILALENQAEKNLLKLAQDQAAISGTILRRIDSEVNIVAKFASNLWSSTYEMQPVRSYSQNDKPKDIYAFSVCGLASGVNRTETISKEINLSSGMDTIFISIASNNPHINTICLGTQSGIYRSYPWRAGREDAYDSRKRFWYTKAAQEQKTVWTAPYIHAATRKLIITCATPFYNDQSEFIGVVEIDLTLSVMLNQIISTQIGKSGYAFLLDEKGNVIARPGLVLESAQWNKIYKTENLLNSANLQMKNIAEKMIAAKSEIHTCEIDGEKKYIAFAPIKTTGWSLGVVMPIKEIVTPALALEKKIDAATDVTGLEINNKIAIVKNMIVGIFAIILAFVFLIAYKISQKITKPISTLRDGTQIIGRGDLEHRLDIKTGDEIEELADAFNKMTANLKNYIAELTKTTVAKERMEKELKIAKEIQLGIVPRTFPAFPDHDEFAVYAHLCSAREVGGDFYDFFMLDDENLFFIIGDVSGKGVPASLFMAVTATLVKTLARKIKEPAELLNVLNREISRDNRSAMFITIFCGILNIKTGSVKFANGGHNPPFVVSENGDIQALDTSGGTVVGIIEDVSYTTDELMLGANDLIYMYTDGVTEAFNDKHEVFSEDRLKNEITKHRQEEIKDLVSHTFHSIETFAKDAPQSDDITILVVKRLK